MDTPITLDVDGETRELTVDTRITVLDALRDRLGVTSPKKGCDHGQCGACTVLLDDRRVNSCLVLAVTADGSAVTTAAGLTDGDDLHPMQQAFIDHDGFQCGYCTPGQICSAVGMLDEAAAGRPSLVTVSQGGTAEAPAQDGTAQGGTAEAPVAEPVPLTDEEIRERMSGNLCRCGAYVNIVSAIRQAAEERTP